MGDAMRRKKLNKSEDVSATASRMYEKMMQALPEGFKPDKGHIHFKEMGLSPFFLQPEKCQLSQDPYGVQLITFIDETCMSVLLRKRQCLEVFKVIPPPHTTLIFDGLDCCLRLKVNPGLRFRASNGELVIPFVVDEESRGFGGSRK